MADLGAVVFDFDGLIVDTETPIFDMCRSALVEMGHDIDVAAWSRCVGLGDADSFTVLCDAVGTELDRGEYDEVYRRQDRSWYDSVPALPGVVDLLGALAALGVPVGVASSSPGHWVERHLDRLGLIDRFDTIATEDRVGGRTKPAPDAYLLACSDLSVDPANAVALEDSANGIRAALAAGMSVVAVPSFITSHTDLSAAHHTVDSLAVLTVDHLQDLVATRRD
ncbi:MAG: HAD-IA family hydrolase [Acidimicrobiales bacterium]|nr:HAD-IA family hydrolase [Acidimicrobiales bacterium]